MRALPCFILACFSTALFATDAPAAAKPASKSGAKAAEKKVVETHEEDPNHWSYTGQRTGPLNWGKMNPAYTQCSEGKEQSPINVTGAVAQQLPPLKIAYGMSKLSIVNNGHTIQVNVESGSWLDALGERYELKQFHFHTPSEELIMGKQFPLVAHLVHKSEAGQLAVIAVLFQEGRENPLIDSLWERMPAEHGESRSYEERLISPASLLPASLKFYTLTGSLTTPPCSEGVRWLILKTPIELSSAQLARFKREFPMNARPTQPINGREVLESM